MAIHTPRLIATACCEEGQQLPSMSMEDEKDDDDDGGLNVSTGYPILNVQFTKLEQPELRKYISPFQVNSGHSVCCLTGDISRHMSCHVCRKRKITVEAVSSNCCRKEKRHTDPTAGM